MCHDILKEEDDEVVSLDEATGDCANDKPHNDLLDEQNGNISIKLNQLTLNDDTAGEDTVASVNGNPIANENQDRLNTTKNKKKNKKNSIKSSTNNDCDSNDNTLDEDANTTSDVGDDRQPDGVHPIKDDVVDVQA